MVLLPNRHTITVVVVLHHPDGNEEDLLDIIRMIEEGHRPAIEEDRLSEASTITVGTGIVRRGAHPWTIADEDEVAADRTTRILVGA